MNWRSAMFDPARRGSVCVRLTRSVNDPRSCGSADDVSTDPASVEQPATRWCRSAVSSGRRWRLSLGRSPQRPTDPGKARCRKGLRGVDRLENSSGLAAPITAEPRPGALAQWWRCPSDGARGAGPPLHGCYPVTLRRPGDRSHPYPPVVRPATPSRGGQATSMRCRRQATSTLRGRRPPHRCPAVRRSSRG